MSATQFNADKSNSTFGEESEGLAELVQAHEPGMVVLKASLKRQVTPAVQSQVEKQFQQGQFSGPLLEALKANSLLAKEEEDAPTPLVQDHAPGDIPLPIKLDRQVTPQVTDLIDQRQKVKFEAMGVLAEKESDDFDAPAMMHQNHAPGQVPMRQNLGRKTTPQVQDLADRLNAHPTGGAVMEAMREDDEEEGGDDKVLDDAPALLPEKKKVTIVASERVDIVGSELVAPHSVPPPRLGLRRKPTPLPQEMTGRRSGPLVDGVQIRAEEITEKISSRPEIGFQNRANSLGDIHNTPSMRAISEEHGATSPRSLNKDVEDVVPTDLTCKKTGPLVDGVRIRAEEVPEPNYIETKKPDHVKQTRANSLGDIHHTPSMKAIKEIQQEDDEGGVVVKRRDSVEDVMPTDLPCKTPGPLVDGVRVRAEEIPEPDYVRVSNAGAGQHIRANSLGNIRHQPSMKAITETRGDAIKESDADDDENGAREEEEAKKPGAKPNLLSRLRGKEKVESERQKKGGLLGFLKPKKAEK
jgi:hypothetical protein